MAYTLRYAPPEVVTADALGESRMAAHPSVDVWALGILALELLAGRRAFRGATPDATVREQIMGGTPLPWEAGRERRELLRSLRGLRPTVLRCLARDAAERPAAAEVLEAWEGLFERIVGVSSREFVPALSPEALA